MTLRKPNKLTNKQNSDLSYNNGRHSNQVEKHGLNILQEIYIRVLRSHQHA